MASKVCSTLSETDIIKAAVRKRAFQTAYEMLKQKGGNHQQAKDHLSSKEKKLERSQEERAAFKVWQTLWKHV